MKDRLEFKNMPWRFCTLGRGVSGVSLRKNAVHGRWKRQHPKKYPLSSKKMLARYANWSDEPDQIMRFTRRYGPLTVDCRSRPKTFSFTVGDWRRAQAQFRALWNSEALLGRGVRFSGTTVDTKAGERFHRYTGRWTYIAATLHRLLCLELFATPINRLRRCVKGDCQRYFVAGHRREKYCSEQCKAWGHRQAKLRWWDKTGNPKRLERVRKEQSVNQGSQSTLRR
jgi:hypothetical protein